MQILRIDEKWSVIYDPSNNDRPAQVLRYGEPSSANLEDLKNDSRVMFYALLGRDATIARLTAELEELTGAQIVNRNAIRMQKAAREKADAELTAANQRAAASVEAVTRANAERDALVAALHEASKRMDDGFSYNAGNAVRALTPPHAAAALDRIKAEARDAALVEAISTCKKVLSEARDYNLSQRAVGASKCIEDLTDLRTQPPQAEPAQVTAQEAAKVLLGAWENGRLMPGAAMLDAGLTEHQSDVASRGMEIALRAIAGEKNE